jgi:hypothetical protein
LEFGVKVGNRDNGLCVCVVKPHGVSDKPLRYTPMGTGLAPLRYTPITSSQMSL